MQILHLYDTYDNDHLSNIAVVNDALEILPVTAHRLNTRYTYDTQTLITAWGYEQPTHIPALLLINNHLHCYMYFDHYDTEEQIVSTIIEFFGVDQ